MPGTSTPIFPQTIKNAGVSIANADASALKTLYTAGTNGSRIDALTVAMTDTTLRDIRLWLNNGTTDFLLCTVSVPVSSGNTNAAPPVDVFRSTMVPGLSFDASGNRVLYLQSGWSLKVNCTSTVTSGQTINIICPAVGDY